jgi:hypothetical protein
MSTLTRLNQQTLENDLQKTLAYFVCVVSLSISKSVAEPVRVIFVHLLPTGVLDPMLPLRCLFSA